MKKVLLTAALLFTFAFSYANEDVSKKEVAIPIEDGKGVSQTNVAKMLPSSIIDDPAFECFALSCDVVCGTWSGGSPTPEQVLDVWGQLEDAVCG